MIENYRAEVLDKLGIGYEVLRSARPDVILVSMAGFGKTGPERDLVGFGPIVEQMGGLSSMTGYGDDGVPYKTGVSYGDPIGGLAAVSAVVLALIQRRRTKRGAWIDLAQRETMAQMACEGVRRRVAARREADPSRQSPPRRGRRRACIPCAGEDQWLAISVRDDAEWRALAATIGAPELAGLALAERRARHDELDARIAAWTQAQDPQAAMESLQAQRIPAAPRARLARHPLGPAPAGARICGAFSRTRAWRRGRSLLRRGGSRRRIRSCDGTRRCSASTTARSCAGCWGWRRAR